jgi:hypothetical protein
MRPIEHSPAGSQRNPGLCLPRALVAAPRNLHPVYDYEHVRAFHLEFDVVLVSVEELISAADHSLSGAGSRTMGTRSVDNAVMGLGRGKFWHRLCPDAAKARTCPF